MLLHLIIIGIVRAVSAPSEGTALTGPKNRESYAFSHFDETEQNAGGPPLHRSFNVDVNGTSECANQKIRTSSFLYEYFFNQFQKSNNSYCNSKKNFSSGKEKSGPPHLDFVYRKRKLLGIEKKSRVKINNSKRSLKFIRKQKQRENSNLQKKGKKITYKVKRRKRDLKNVDINDEVDINKRIEKLVKQIALENLRTQEPDSATELAEPSKEISNHVKGLTTETRGFSPFFKRIFRFNKKYSTKNITNDDAKVGSVPVKIVQDPIPVVMARSGSDDVVESIRKTTRSRRNPRKPSSPRYAHFVNAIPKLNKQFDVFNGDANNKDVSYFPKSKKFLPGGRKRKRRRNEKVRSRLPNDSDGYGSKYRIKYGTFDSWLKKHDDRVNKESRKNNLLNPIIIQLREKSMAKSEKPIYLRKNKAGLSIANPEDVNQDRLEKMHQFGIKIKLRVPPQTLERPLLQQPMANYTQKKAKFYKYELPNDENLSPYRYLEIRHALRNYLIHNEVWNPSRKDSLNEKRTKRREGSFYKRCSKSAPLLCIPYIKKGQDEMLRQIIRSVQKMMEKPIPEKVDIFEKTKFKPCIKKESDHRRENKPSDESGEPKTEPCSKCPSNHNKHRSSTAHTTPAPKNACQSKNCPSKKCSSAPKSCSEPKTSRKSSSKNNPPPSRKHASSSCPTNAPGSAQCSTPPPFPTPNPGLSHKGAPSSVSSQASTHPPYTTTQFSVQCTTRPASMSSCPICLPCPTQCPSSTFSTHSSFSTAISFLPCPTTPFQYLSMPPPTPNPLKPTTSCFTTPLPTINTTLSCSTYFPIPSTTVCHPAFSSTQKFSTPPPPMCHSAYPSPQGFSESSTATVPSFAPTPYFSNPPGNICHTTFSQSSLCVESVVATIPTTHSTTPCPPLTSKTPSVTCPTHNTTTGLSTTGPTSLTEIKSTSHKKVTSSTTISTTAYNDTEVTTSTECGDAAMFSTTSVFLTPKKTTSTEFFTPKKTTSTEFFTPKKTTFIEFSPSTSELSLFTPDTTLDTLTTRTRPCEKNKPTLPNFTHFKTTSGDLPCNCNCLSSHMPTLATIPFINTSTTATPRCMLSSTPQALRNFLQTLSPRPNMFNSKDGSFSYNFDQMATPTSYFSPTSYFLNDVENPPPFSGMQNSGGFPQNFGHNFLENTPPPCSSMQNSGGYPQNFEHNIFENTPCPCSSMQNSGGFPQNFGHNFPENAPSPCSSMQNSGGFPLNFGHNFPENQPSPCSSMQNSGGFPRNYGHNFPENQPSPCSSMQNSGNFPRNLGHNFPENQPSPCSSMQNSGNFPRNFGHSFFPNRSDIFPCKNPGDSFGSMSSLSKSISPPPELFPFQPPTTDSADKLFQDGRLMQMPNSQPSALPMNMLNMKNNNNPDWTLTFARLSTTEPVDTVDKKKNKATHEDNFEEVLENNDSKEKLKGNKKLTSNENLKTEKITNRNFLSNKLMKFRQDNENIYKKITKPRRHRLNTKCHHKSEVESPAYDMYERSPSTKSTEKGYRYQKYPFPWLFHQRRIKKHAKRQKREDCHYAPAEDPEYQRRNDANFGALKDFQLVRPRETQAEEPFFSSDKEPETTPFFFALFSELAKVIAQPDQATELNDNYQNQEDSSKAPEKRKSEPFSLLKDTDSNGTTTSLAEKAIIQSLKGTFMDDSETENATTSTEDSILTKATTRKCKVTIKRKKTTVENTLLSTTPLKSSESEATTCYCEVITTTGTSNGKTTEKDTDKTTDKAPDKTTDKCTNKDTTTPKVTSAEKPTSTDKATEAPVSKRCRPKTTKQTESLPTTTDKMEIEEEMIAITDGTDEGQMPSTLKTANIVKGPKKLLEKPSPKTYTKVYPDSLANDLQTNETKVSLPNLDVVKKMPMHIFPISNNRLQLLAVCEGYLEVIRLIKAQNQSLEGGVDADLTRYCESIISQSFTFASDNDMKLKKMKLGPTSPSFSESLRSVKKHRSTNGQKPKVFSNGELPEDLSNRELRDKIVVDILSSPVYKRELAAKIDLNRNKKFKNKSHSQINLRNKKAKYNKIKKSKSYRPASDCSTENLRRFRRKDKTEEELVGKGIPKEQIKLLHLLRKRKRALLSWLFNSKEDQIKPDDMRETEYLDDEEYVTPNPDLKEATGKITPKVDDTTPKTPTNETTFVQSTMYPVYAKNYGYDKGGELRVVDVLWRKVNEKTHEKKIFKNQSVLALLLAPTNPLNPKLEEARPSENDNEDMSERSGGEDSVSFAEPSVLYGKLNSTASTRMMLDNSSIDNNTQTIMSKPDASSIVGTPPNATTPNPNMAHKLSRALATAKELFQEYIIEFLNYAVYILPIMFTLLFLFCCVCCFMQVLRNKKNRKKKKKKRKKKKGSSDEESDDDAVSTDSEVKKKVKRKKPDKKKAHPVENLEKKPSRTIWSVLRLNSGKPSSEFNDDNSQADKKSFLWFLRGKKDEGKIEELPYTTLHELDENSVGYKSIGGKKPKELRDSDEVSGSVFQNEGRKKRKEQKMKMDEQIEANERRELIALLEELKKIEMEKADEKKEQKSVYVQYMTQEDDNAFSVKQESRPKQSGKPRAHSLCQKHFSFDEGPAFQNYEFYEDVGELTELLPCERSSTSKRNDYLRHPDFRINQGERCERFFKIIRDSGVTQNKHFREMDFMKSGDRGYIFNKYKTISTGTTDELLGGTDKNSETEITDTVLPFSLSNERKINLIEEMENLKRQLNKKKYVRLKDNGVLCRL